MPERPVKTKNPVGRPRKDGLPAGYYKHFKVAQAHAPTLKIATSEAAVQVEKRPCSRPPKNGTMPGSKRDRKASASAPVSQLAPESSPLSLPLPPRYAPPQTDVGVIYKPKVGYFICLATEAFYNTHISTPSDTATEFDDETDEENAETDDTDVGAIGLVGTERILSRFRLDDQRKMFPLVEAEDDPPPEEEQKAQTEEERRETSRQRQKKMCEAHNCYDQSCRINHVRRANLAFFLQGLDQRESQLNELRSQFHELVGVEAESTAPIDDSTTVEGGARPAYLLETESNHVSQFEELFSGIMQGRGID